MPVTFVDWSSEVGESLGYESLPFFAFWAIQAGRQHRVYLFVRSRMYHTARFACTTFSGGLHSCFPCIPEESTYLRLLRLAGRGALDTRVLYKVCAQRLGPLLVLLSNYTGLGRLVKEHVNERP